MEVNGLLLLTVLVCVITDIRSRKIPNVVVYPGLIIAFGLHGWLGGWIGLEHAVLGFAAGFALLLGPYLLGGMGAGDVKLLALVGALKGVAFLLTAAFYMAVIGGGIAIAVILLRRGAKARLRAIAYFLYGLRFGIRLPGVILKEDLTATYPYGVAIAGGALLGLLRGGWGIAG